jgi:hypothetical protein
MQVHGIEKRLAAGAAIVVAGLALASSALAAPVGKSDLPSRDWGALGVKWPNSPAEGTHPVTTRATVPTTLGGFAELVPYIVAAPDQEEAGSCLYMAMTGIAEWWLARLHPNLSRAHDGPIDLSERYMMNLAGIDENQDGVPNWKTDSIYIYNRAGHGVINTAYRFTKGWYTTDADGSPLAATSATKDASYGTMYNWIDQTSIIHSGNVELPTFDRDVLFADPASNQWNTGVMPDDIVATVKTALTTKKAPINVIYNHFGYWHSVDIVGFDDDASSDGCGFVEEFDKYMPSQAAELRNEASHATDPKEKAALTARADKFDKLGAQFHAAYTGGGGCAGKGIFYVRDSIYADPSDPYVFDADGGANGTGSYSKPVITHEYEWLRYMANHATQVYVK